MTHNATLTNEELVRQAYQIAEDYDLAGWQALFAEDGTFTDESSGVTYRGEDVSIPVTVMKTAFSDMHRELYQVYVAGDVVIVQLALQGTHDGPFTTPQGSILPTGNRMDAPCCDVFQLENGKIKRFDCYPSGTVMFGQLGVLGNLAAAFTGSPDD